MLINIFLLRITRELEDTVWIKFVNTTNRKLYCIQILELQPDQNTQQVNTDSCKVNFIISLQNYSFN